LCASQVLLKKKNWIMGGFPKKKAPQNVPCSSTKRVRKVEKGLDRGNSQLARPAAENQIAFGKKENTVRKRRAYSKGKKRRRGYAAFAKGFPSFNPN